MVQEVTSDTALKSRTLSRYQKVYKQPLHVARSSR